MKKKNIDNDELVTSVLDDFKKRQSLRKSYETIWQLNINFLIGNQYCSILNDEIVDHPRQYFWQEREVFNHIAPIIDLRISKLGKIRPTLTVLPFSDEEKDVACAKISKKLLKSISYDINMSQLLSNGTMWSEICGTSFYKVTWNAESGRPIGVNESGVVIKEGDVQVDVVSPFEIYPDSNTYTNIEDCTSIIHARAYSCDQVKSIWGVDVEGDDIDVFTLENMNTAGGLGYCATNPSIARKRKSNNVLVLEKYEKPTVEYPNGRVIIIAKDKLVYEGELPYINEINLERGFPFVKQNCLSTPNCFWGSSVIERCIPIQRAYNAVKNRKHEFLNRLAMGVLAVEDGSVDIENLEEEGMSPGKVLIYRQGSTPPHLLSSGTIPTDFNLEEDRLLAEFLTVSGVSDLLSNSTLSTSNISGVALQLLIEQDEARITSSAEEIRNACKLISKHILRLYKQFAILPHTSRLVSDSGTIEMLSWKNSDISSEDVVFETENELSQTVAQKRSMIYEALKSGLLSDENGVLSNSTRQKVLEQLGMGIWETSQDITTLQKDKAMREDINLLENNLLPNPQEIDDHEIHINTHIAFMLSSEFERAIKHNGKLSTILLEHIRKHRQFNKVTEQMDLVNKVGEDNGK